MYWLLLIVLLAAGAWALRAGLRRGSPLLRAAGVGVMVATPAFFALLTFWSELMWFEALGYSGRFWRVVGAQLAISPSRGSSTPAIT